jgi:hypothetical protein
MNPYNEDELNARAMEAQARFHNVNSETQQAQQVAMVQDEERNMIKDQLSLDEELTRIQNLLQGKTEFIDEYGQHHWQEPKSSDDILLTDSGINLVLNTIQWYLNKNTLLSNYDEATINFKMEDFATSLADALFMNYEKYFRYPTMDECQEKLIKRLERKQEAMIYNMKLYGTPDEEIDKEEIWLQLINEIDPEKERIKIKEQEVKNKLKGFDLLLRKIQDCVHSAYLRALAGQERKTLREHIHISESRGGMMMPQRQGSKLNPFGWFKK